MVCVVLYVILFPMDDEKEEVYKLENIVDRPSIVYYIDGGGLCSCMKFSVMAKFKVHLQCSNSLIKTTAL